MPRSADGSSYRRATVGDRFALKHGWTPRRIPQDAAPSTATRILGPNDLQYSGTIAPTQGSSRTARAKDIPAEFLLQPGDLLVSRAIIRGMVRAAWVRHDDLPAAAGQHLVRLRPEQDVPQPYARLIITYLHSGVLDHLAVGSTDLQHLKIRDLAEVPLPDQDDALTDAVQELVTASAQLRQWGDEAGGVVRGVFQTDGRADRAARQRVIEAGQLSRLRADAAAQLDDFGYTVRTRFPFPIASRWREVEARKSAKDLPAAYHAVLATAEILIGYCALLTAALAREASIELTNVNNLRDNLLTKSGGPGFGDWTNIVKEISSKKKRRDLPEDHPLHDLGKLLSDENTDKARKRLAKRRNDESHLRPADMVDLPGELEAAYRDLSLLLTRAAFLADMPLVEVTSVKWNAFRKQATLSLRRLMGDHPVVPTEIMRYASSDIESESLHLLTRDRSLHLLRPFLIGQVCPTCRSWSTFHLDKVEGVFVLKSLEHGHLLPTIDEASMREAGLL